MIFFYHFRFRRYLLTTIVLLLYMLAGIVRSYAQAETFPAGSYIINMGITPQTQANSLRLYGLIYDLLKKTNLSETHRSIVKSAAMGSVAPPPL